MFSVAIVGSPVAAQEDDTGALLDLLQHVPSNAVETGGLVTYVDLRAVESAQHPEQLWGSAPSQRAVMTFDNQWLVSAGS